VRRPLRAIAAGIVAGHRSLFIAGTAVLAVGTTELTDDACRTGPWLVTLGAAVLMYVGDVLDEVNRDSLDLSRRTETMLAQARLDVFAERSPRRTTAALLVAVGAIASGFVL
jgi:hypothetical protein